jgi:hypothetical protein
MFIARERLNKLQCDCEIFVFSVFINIKSILTVISEKEAYEIV